MTKRQILAAALAVVALSAGCHSNGHHKTSWVTPDCEQSKLTVRFVNQPGLFLTSDWQNQSEHTTCNNSSWSLGGLFSCNSCQHETCTDYTTQAHGDSVNLCSMGGLAGGTDDMPQHAVLWGGGYNGNDVTGYPTNLAPGSYTFAYFEPDRGAAYQGWLSVNNGGDDVLSALTEWRDTVHQQEEWLAFEYKINGKYASPDKADFKRFQGQLANLRSLEGKINSAINAEQKDRDQMCQYQFDYLGNTQVVIMPGSTGTFAQASTLPAFQPADLSAVQGGQPLTKVILAGDFARSMEKVDRLADLQSEMRRCRAVLNEEIVRLDNRRNYFRLTSHLYNQDYNFLNNEQRVQQARGLLSNLDRQIAENRRHAHAVLTVVGLFAPEEADLAFDREQMEIRGERAVWAERLNQVELQFSDASTWSEKRISLERQRQFLLSQVAECDVQLDQCEQASDAVAQLRQNAGVIYRNGPASVLAASFVTDSVPARLANAIEKEALMTIRLHSAEGVRPTPKHLTEGGMFNEQMFMLTNDKSNYEQPTLYNGNWDNDQPSLIEWSKTQRNYGDSNNNSNCGQSNYDQP